jgi:hypothetical protein
MLSIPIGWEVSNIVNGGANVVIPLTRSLWIKGYEIDISLGFVDAVPGPVTVAPVEVLCMGMIANGSPAFAGTAQYPTSPAWPNPDFKPALLVNPNKFDINPEGNEGYGALFAAILKTNAPTATGKTLCMSGLNINAPAGSSLVFHMDAMSVGSVPGDVEMQGVVFYE